MSLILATRLANARPLIVPRGSSSVSRMVAVLDDRVSRFVGENSYRTHPLVKKFSSHPDRVCIHCEAAAVIKVINYFTGKLGVSRSSVVSGRVRLDLSGFKLSVARVLASGNAALAAPCVDCRRILNHFNIHNVEWTQ